MKPTKEDYMRLSKERLAELLVEMDSHPIEPIVIPAQPTSPSVPLEPWKLIGPTITYEGAPNTNSADVNSNLHAQ